MGRADEGREPLSRDRILAAALAMADEGGIEAVSMRKLGERLGVKAMSLYNHVANKDDIVLGILDRVIAEVELPPAGTPWRQALRLRSQQAHAVLLRHPWACTLIPARANTNPAMMRYVEWTLATLLEAGFTAHEADEAWYALDSHLYGFTLQHLSFPFEHDAIPEVASSFLPQLPQEQFPALWAVTTNMLQSEYAGKNSLEFGLDLLLDGLEARLRARRDGRG